MFQIESEYLLILLFISSQTPVMRPQDPPRAVPGCRAKVASIHRKITGQPPNKDRHNDQAAVTRLIKEEKHLRPDVCKNSRRNDI
jgi:hypothetical protein